ncbi:hypothetical protein LZ30DRAFT_782885 [Colletotrichum cereale]|nr:hypothetical protein LZ30DRAFT_782885 [Colletotrichum cereale]
MYYGVKLNHKGLDLVGNAVDHYVGYSTSFVDFNLTSAGGDLHWADGEPH